MPVDVCQAPGCESPVYARAHCSRHYRQLLRHGQVQADPAPTACAVASCDRRAVTRGWCHGHYIRWHRSGEVKPEVPLVRQVVDTCTIEGCGRGATSGRLCRSHYNRLRKYGDPLAGGPIRTVTGGGSISHGYWWIAVPEQLRHLVPNGRKHEFEHRIVMAAVIGRPLFPEETVHHLNGDRLDNRPENLELWSTAQPRGQRVADKARWAQEMLRLYAAATHEGGMKEDLPEG